MRQIRELIHEFWSGFFNRSANLPAPVSLKAFQSGFAVEYGSGAPAAGRQPELPYITYTLPIPDALNQTIITGIIFDRRQTHGLVDDVLEQAREKVPAGGLRLESGKNQAIWLYRSNPFTDYLPPENDDQLNRAGIIRLIIQNYTI